MEQERLIKLKCVFCQSTNFDVPKGYEPKAGEQIKCANCGRSNDYDSLFCLVKKEVIEIGRQIAEDEVKKMLKRVLK